MVNILNIDFSNLVRLFRKGDITKVYSKMYDLAEYIAIHEMKLYRLLLQNEMDEMKKAGFHPKDIASEYTKKSYEYKKERIQTHIKEMKELLVLHLKEKK